MNTSGNCEILLHLVWCKNRSHLELRISFCKKVVYNLIVINYNGYDSLILKGDGV